MFTALSFYRFNPDNTKAIEKSQAYARSMGYPELTKVLTPRVTGTNLFIEELGNDQGVAIMTSHKKKRSRISMFGS